MQRKNLVIGCGKKDRQYTHPALVWVSLDEEPRVKPDITASVSDPDLMEKMADKGFIPGSFNVIFSEGVAIEEYITPQFAENISALLVDDGVLIIDNLLPYDLMFLSKYFKGTIVRFPDVTLFTKLPLSSEQILDQLNSVEHECPEIIFLLEQIKEMQSICNFYQLDESPQNLQVVAMYLLLINFLARKPECDDALFYTLIINLEEMMLKKNFSILSFLISSLCADEPVKTAAATFDMTKWDEATVNNCFDELCEPTELNAFHSFLAMACTLDPKLKSDLDKITCSTSRKIKEFASAHWQQFSLFAVGTAVAAAGVMAINEMYKRSFMP